MNIKEKGGIEIFLILGIVIISVVLAGGLSTKNDSLSASDNSVYNIDSNVQTGSSNAVNNLQIKTFLGTKSTPPPTVAPVTNPAPPLVVVPPGETPPSGSVEPAPNPPPPGPCQGSAMYCSCQLSYEQGGPTDGHKISCPNPGGGTAQHCIDTLNASNPGCVMTPALQSQGCTDSCYDKPVIYLYPDHATNVSVKINTTGKIVVSDPLYINGWENVLAFPDGKLIYKNKAYSELFYETNVSDKYEAKDGIIFESQNTEDNLYELTTQLGLIKSEQNELVEYWTPRLKSLNKKYILVTLIDQKTKDKTDKVLITPKPDTRIEFLLYFKGLDKKINIPKLNLSPIPQRKGFTSVEWGGTISN